MPVEIEARGIERPGQPRTLGMKVRNIGTDPISALVVLFEWENEQQLPQHAQPVDLFQGNSAVEPAHDLLGG
jgi:hypothetical protein